MLQHIIQKTDELRESGYAELTINKDNFDELLQSSLKYRSFKCLIILLAEASNIGVKVDFFEVLVKCLTVIEKTHEDHISGLVKFVDFESLEQE